MSDEEKRLTMLSRMATEKLRTTLLIGSTVALLAGTGMAVAQEDPPGAQFQNQGVREEIGKTPRPSVWSRTARMRGYGAYAYAPGRLVVRHHRFIRHHRFYD